MGMPTMPSTIFTAPTYNPARERKRKLVTIVVVCVVVLAAGLAWWFRYWPQEHQVDRFFDALQAKNYKAAYGVWMHDPAWEQHPQQYSRYPFPDFYSDWGPGGEWGLVNTHHVDCAASPSGGSGVIVVVTVNGRVQKALVWVETSDKTLSFPPPQLQASCH